MPPALKVRIAAIEISRPPQDQQIEATDLARLTTWSPASTRTDRASRRLCMAYCSLLGAIGRLPDVGGVVVTDCGSRVALCPTWFGRRTRRVLRLQLNTLVHPQKITLTCQIVKITLRACYVGIPFAVDRHGARTPCRSSRKPRGVVMAHAVRKDIVLRRSSRSTKDFQTRPADAIHNYVKSPLIGTLSVSIMARCLLPNN
jgi:hypothetical protein